MNTFFISNEKAVGPGFGLFSANHFFALAVLALLSFGLIRIYLRANDERRKLLRLLVASFTLLLEFREVHLNPSMMCSVLIIS